MNRENTPEQKPDALINRFIREMKFNCQPSVVPLIANECARIAETIAKERSIGFGNWAALNCECRTEMGMDGYWWTYKGNSYRTEQLYNLYLEQLKNKQ